MTYIKGILFFAVLALTIGSMAKAQSPPTAEELYGQGVYAFNSKDYNKAIQIFDQLEVTGTPDPRPFFFRGLSYSRLNDATAAEKDYQYAASLELSVAGRSYSVPKALERVQGDERALIEYYRRAARQKWDDDQGKIRQIEFQRQQAKGQQVYNTIIQAGNVSDKELAELQSQVPQMIPFGARPIDPYGTLNINTSTSGEKVDLTLSEENLFHQQLMQKAELPKAAPKPKPVAPAKPKDAFDALKMGTDLNLGTSGVDEIEGLDTKPLFLPSQTSVDDFDDFSSSFTDAPDGNISANKPTITITPVPGNRGMPSMVPAFVPGNGGEAQSPGVVSFGGLLGGGMSKNVPENTEEGFSPGKSFGKGLSQLFKKSK